MRGVQLCSRECGVKRRQCRSTAIRLVWNCARRILIGLNSQSFWRALEFVHPDPTKHQNWDLSWRKHPVKTAGEPFQLGAAALPLRAAFQAHGNRSAMRFIG